MTEQAKDVYTWHVVYDDEETVISEDDDNNFSVVDQARAKTVLLLPYPLTLPLVGPSHRVDIPTGAQPVFFRRRSIEINLVQEQSQPRPTVHCIGWKRGDDAQYLFVFDDGSTLLSSDLQAV